MRSLTRAAVAAIALAGASILSPALADTQPKQGGAVVVTFKDDLATLDPAVGYDWQNWSIIKSIFSGLMDYKPGTTELMPDLAESYTIADDGLTYTFTLRPNLKFHNGRAVTAADVKYSIERAVNPKTQCPGAGYFSMIKGYDDAAAGKTTDISGIKTPDDKTVVFTLNHPDATFLHIMAINFAFVVPKEEVAKYGADFGHHPVGTGAFQFGEWELGQKLVLNRFKDYHRPGVPYLDQITFEFGQEPTVALLRLKKGEVDILGDGIPPAQFLQVTGDPANKDLYVRGEQMHTGYVTLNVKVKPFDNLKVRQAVAYAIPYQKIMDAVLFGLSKPMFGAPAGKPLEVAWPQPHSYNTDIYKAKKLMAEAGYPDGFETTLSFDLGFAGVNEPLCVLTQESLAQIGIKCTINKIPGATWRTELNKKVLPLYTNVFSGWLDYPEYFFIWCYHGKNSIFNTMSYQSKTLDSFVDGAVTAAANGDKAAYEKDVKGFVETAFADMPRIPIFQPYVNVAMQKNVTGYQYWFHRRLDYRAFEKG